MGKFASAMRNVMGYCLTSEKMHILNRQTSDNRHDVLFWNLHFSIALVLLSLSRVVTREK